MMKEYMVHVWGGMFNKNAEPSIEKELGISEGYYYFNTEQEKDDFLSKVTTSKYEKQGLAIDEKCGEMSHKRTIFVADLQYRGNLFPLYYDFGYEYEAENAIYMFVDGDYSCDCNRSLLIRREYGEESISELDCGDEIKMLNYFIEYWD